MIVLTFGHHADTARAWCPLKQIDVHLAHAEVLEAGGVPAIVDKLMVTVA